MAHILDQASTEQNFVIIHFESADVVSWHWKFDVELGPFGMVKRKQVEGLDLTNIPLESLSTEAVQFGVDGDN